MITTMAVLFSACLILETGCNEIIERMKEHSEKIRPFTCVIELYPVSNALFDDREEAIQYETERLRQLETQVGRTMDEETFQRTLESNVERLLTDREPPNPTTYLYTCLDEKTFTIRVIDNDTNLRQILVFIPEARINYEPMNRRLSIYRTDSNSINTSRYIIRPFKFEEYLQMIKRDSIDPFIECKDSTRMEIIAGGDVHLLQFEDEEAPIPYLYERIMLEREMRAEFHVNEFQDYDGVMLPSQLTMIQYSMHPITGEEYKQTEGRYRIVEFEFRDDLDIQDIDVDIPAETMVGGLPLHTAFDIEDAESVTALQLLRKTIEER